MWFRAGSGLLDIDSDLILNVTVHIGYDPVRDSAGHVMESSVGGKVASTVGNPNDSLQSLTGIYRDALNPDFVLRLDSVKVTGSFEESQPSSDCGAAG